MTPPTLAELADGVVETSSQVPARFGPRAAAECDQLYAVARDKLLLLGVDIDDPDAARAIIAMYEVGCAAHRAAGGVDDPHAANTAVANILTAAAVAAANRHATGAAAAGGRP